MTAPLQQLLNEARGAFGAAACSFAALDEEEGELSYEVASGIGADAIVGVRLPITRGVAGWVAVSAQPLAVSDLRSDPRFAADVAESTRYIPRALLGVPVVGPYGVLGVLSILDRDSERADSQHDLALAAEYAARAAVLLTDAAPDALPAELHDLAALLRDASPARRATLRAALQRLLDDGP